MARLTLTGLTKRYGALAACNGIDLEVGDGEFLSLLGPSGCGKTTTLQLLAGFLVPDAGEIRLDDRVISSAQHVVPPERREMSMIFQSYAIWPHKTVFENVAFGLQVRRVGRDQIRRRVTEMLDKMRLATLADRYPAELSGGQQQRVALARALVVEPKTLLLDEPLSNLDANLREEMRFLIRALHQQEVRITMIYVTHDQAEAMVTSDRIAVMNAGRIEQLGTPTEIYERPRTQFVATFIGRSNIIPGIRAGNGVVNCQALALRTADLNGRAGESVMVCVRPHEIRLELASGAASPHATDNLLSGRVRRGIYLGEARDYLVQIDGSELLLRVQRPGGEAYPVDADVWVRIPPAACHLVQPS